MPLSAKPCHLTPIYLLNAPYYIVPLVEEYRQLDPKSERAKTLSRKISANIGDYASLRLVLGIDPEEFARFYPDMEMATPSTMDTIDSFLDKFGKDLPPAGYVPEMPSEAEAADPDNSSAPLEAAEPVNPLSGVEEEAQPSMMEYSLEDDYENESGPAEAATDDLASLMKSKRYEEALQFIERQNLNNTEKSIYFAHQMRFLRKLIALETFKQQRKG